MQLLTTDVQSTVHTRIHTYIHTNMRTCMHVHICKHTYTQCCDNIRLLIGHAFAGGAIVALAHDYRVMRSGRGWFCLPEIKLKLQIPMEIMQLVK